MLAILLTLGWLACVVYATIPSFWLLIHPYAEFWRSRRLSPYYVLIPLWFAMWTLVAALTLPWHETRLYTTPWTWIPAALLFLLGFALYRAGGLHFSLMQLGGLPELHYHPQVRLVTTGIRRYMRHPIYLGHLLEMLAWSLGTGLIICYILTVFAVATGAIMIRFEDDELERRFGLAFLRYKANVPAILPRPRRT